MFETVFGCVLIAIVARKLVYSTLGRVYGFHRSARWDWGLGGEITLVGDLSVCVFLGCIGAVALGGSAIWVILALMSAMVACISWHRANRRDEAEKEDLLRKTNSLNYPGVFDDRPPDDIEAIEDEELDLFDAGACTYIGVVPKSDIRAIIQACAGMPEQGPNDIFVDEPLDMLAGGEITQQTVSLLTAALEQRNYLLLRWMPRSRDTP